MKIILEGFRTDYLSYLFKVDNKLFIREIPISVVCCPETTMLSISSHILKCLYFKASEGMVFFRKKVKYN